MRGQLMTGFDICSGVARSGGFSRQGG